MSEQTEIIEPCVVSARQMPYEKPDKNNPCKCQWLADDSLSFSYNILLCSLSRNAASLQSFLLVTSTGQKVSANASRIMETELVENAKLSNFISFQGGFDWVSCEQI